MWDFLKRLIFESESEKNTTIPKVNKSVIKIAKSSKDTSRDGTLIPTENKGEHKFVTPSQRMQEFKFEDVAIHPFSFNEFNPKLIKKTGKLRWEYLREIGTEYAGISVLKDSQNQILFAVKYCTYIHTFNEGRSFVFYGMAARERDNKHFLDLYYFETDTLRPLIDQSDKALLEFSKMKNSSGALYNSFCDEEKIELNDDTDSFKHEFNGNFKLIDELLIVVPRDWIKFPNSTIVRILPKTDSIEIYPQDWYNNASYDFDYQWITFVGRDKKTSKIHGCGIRIANFTLDQTYRERDNGGETVFF